MTRREKKYHSARKNAKMKLRHCMIGNPPSGVCFNFDALPFISRERYEIFKAYSEGRQPIEKYKSSLNPPI